MNRNYSEVEKSLQLFFETLRERNNGRFSNKDSMAQSIVCSAITLTATDRKLHEIADATGASIEALSKAREKWHLHISGDTETFFAVRGKIRKDKICDEHLEFGVKMWQSLCRPSEKKNDSAKHPRRLKDPTVYRIYFQEMRFEDIHNHIANEGKKRFGDDFHWSRWMTAKVKPFYIRSGKRDTCL